MRVALYQKELSGDDLVKLDFLLGKMRSKGIEVVSPDESDIDMLFALGGDGTFLRSLTLVRGRDIPVAGVNFGRLGFLTTARVDAECRWIDELAAGNYSVEERTLLKITGDALPATFYNYAANEISILRTGTSVIEVKASLDGRPIPQYWADGVVIATPTGSTAYSLSVGGPIVTPDADVLIISPIAPHNLNMRPLVVPGGSTFDIEFYAREGNASLTLDNRSMNVPSGSRFTVGKGEYGFRRVSISGNSFINALSTKLLWGEDRRNKIL